MAFLGELVESSHFQMTGHELLGQGAPLAAYGFRVEGQVGVGVHSDFLLV